MAATADTLDLLIAICCRIHLARGDDLPRAGDVLDRRTEDHTVTTGVLADHAGYGHVQQDRMPGEGNIGQDPVGVIASAALDPAARTVQIRCQDLAPQVSAVLAIDGSTGDRHPQLDGSAGRIGDIGSKLGHGSCGVQKERVE